MIKLKIEFIEARDLPDLWFQAVYNILNTGRQFVIDKGSYAGQTRLEYDYFIGHIKYPLVSDLTKEISSSYGILLDKSVSLRGTFLIDKNNVIRHQVVNDLPLGRNIDEALRMVDALIFHEKHGEVCQAGWNNGDKGIVPTSDGIAEYLGNLESK